MKSGDKVKLINKSRLESVRIFCSENRLGTLDIPLTRREIEGYQSLNGEEAWWVRMDPDNYGYKARYYIPLSCLELVYPKYPRFRVGDHVKVAREHPSDTGVKGYIGRSGTITRARDVDWCGERCWYIDTLESYYSIPESCLESTASSSFSKDDRVVLIENDELARMGCKGLGGKKGTILSITDSGNWSVRLDGNGTYYLPDICMSLEHSAAGFQEGKRVRLKNPTRLREISLGSFDGKIGTLKKKLSSSETTKKWNVNGEPCWYVDVDLDGYLKPVKCYVVESCMELVDEQPTTTNQQANKTETINKQKEENMYYYKIRFTQVPHQLAMQAGEKESVVAVENDIGAVDQNAAIAMAAAKHAAEIKKVEESKACLHVTVKTD